MFSSCFTQDNVLQMSRNDEVIFNISFLLSDQTPSFLIRRCMWSRSGGGGGGGGGGRSGGGGGGAWWWRWLYKDNV